MCTIKIHNFSHSTCLSVFFCKSVFKQYFVGSTLKHLVKLRMQLFNMLPSVVTRMRRKAAVGLVSLKPGSDCLLSM